VYSEPGWLTPRASPRKTRIEGLSYGMSSLRAIAKESAALFPCFLNHPIFKFSIVKIGIPYLQILSNLLNEEMKF
jgi:hypothetical protein